MLSDAELFTLVGRALWGETWKGEASRELEVRKGTIGEWSRGAGASIPTGIWDKLTVIAERRHVELERLMPELLQAKANARSRMLKT